MDYDAIDAAVKLLESNGYYIKKRHSQRHEHADKIAELKAGGMSFNAIGKIVDLSGARVSQIYHRDVPIEKKANIDYKRRDADIYAAYRLGTPKAELAATHGLKVSTVSTIIHSAKFSEQWHKEKDDRRRLLENPQPDTIVGHSWSGSSYETIRYDNPNRKLVADLLALSLEEV